MTEPAFSSRDFRDALGGFATGVTIVTARDSEGVAVGMTASSFNSVSMDPPLILWSVTKSARSAAAFYAATHFSVHVLSSDQVDLSNRFARSGTDKFADLDVINNANDVPTIGGAVCRFDCRQWAVHEGGDHWIIVGYVENLVRHHADALVFCGGSYATANPLRAPSEAGLTSEGASSPIDGLLIYNLARAFHQLANEFHGSVRGSGLSVAEWRILASLHGQAHRKLTDLAARTFIDIVALRDITKILEEEGLCRIEGAGEQCQISGTAAGHTRVEHLFAHGRTQEQAALNGISDDGLPKLIELLQMVIQNTRAVA
jgi:3-hydroxy-9,10-secoandrosta-1,3,5(10)-triene-9,17-dione monooxygenase reductase component